MKTNFTTIALIVVCIASLAVAYHQKTLASHYRLLAIENELKWREATELAEQQRLDADRNRMIAEQQTRMAIAAREEALRQAHTRGKARNK